MSEATPQSAPAAPSPSRRRRVGRFLLRLALFFALLAGVVALVQRPLLEWTIREALLRGLPGAGLQMVSGRVSASIGQPLLLSDFVLTASSAAPSGNRTSLRIERIEVAPVSLRQMLSGPFRPVARITVEGIDGVLDLRPATMPPLPPLPDFTAEQELMIEEWLGRLLPARMAVSVLRFEVLAEDQRYEIASLRANFDEGKIGGIRIDSAALAIESAHISASTITGRTAWKHGTVYLSGMKLSEEIVLRDLIIDIGRLGGPSVQLDADLFGGWIRAETSFGVQQGMVALDFTCWGGRLPIAPIYDWLHLPPGPSGRIGELRLNYRGAPEDFFGGNAALWLRGEELGWKERSLDSLILGCELRQRAVEISTVDLAHQTNQISASGRVLVPDDGDWLRTEIRIDATLAITDLAPVAKLAGESLAGTVGKLHGNISLKSSGAEPRGEVSLAGESLALCGVPLGHLSASATFRGKEIEIGEFALNNDADLFRLQGRINLAEPYVYEGTIHAKVHKIHEMLAPFTTTPPLAGGGITLDWQGDGTLRSHSGAISVTLEEFRSQDFPFGINAVLSATYSPENWFFHQFQFSDKRAQLGAAVSAGKTGISAKNVRLESSGKNLLWGEVYLPFDPISALEEKSWTAGILAEKEIYAELNSNKWKLGELAALFGQKLPVEGNVRLGVSASATLDAPLVTAALDFDDLRATNPERSLLATSANFRLHGEGGKARIEGAVRAPNLQPLSIDLRFPFGARLVGDTIELQNPTGSLEGKILLPGTELAPIASMLPGLEQMRGSLSGEILLGGAIPSPTIAGRLSLRGVNFDPGRDIPPLQNFSMDARFDGTSFRLENTGGAVGAGAFQISGGGEFLDPSNPSIDLRLTGKELLLARSRNLRLRANADLTIKGGRQGGQVAGEVALVEGRVFQRLEITPLLQSSQTDNDAPLLLPDLAGHVPPPFNAWKLDVRVTNASPFLFQGNLASGAIEPDLRIVGALGDPRPTGTVTLRGLKAFLPFSVVTIPEGRITLIEQSPRVPMLDVRGFSEVLDYDIQLIAEGPLDEKNLFLRSDPPLSQEAILLLLTTGLPPGINQGAGLGEAAIGQGGILLLKTFARHFENDSVNLDSLINRLQISTLPPVVTGLRPTLRAQFRLTDRFGILTQRDGYGFLGAGVTYSIRFR